MKDLIKDMNYKIAAIQSHATELTPGNVSHHKQMIKGCADHLQQDLRKLKIIVNKLLCQK